MGGKGIEYGSGRSTLFFSGLLDELQSVEHQSNWFKKAQEMLSENKIENTTLHLIPANQDFKEPSLNSEEQFFRQNLVTQSMILIFNPI